MSEHPPTTEEVRDILARSSMTPYSVFFPPSEDADEREQDDYWAWYDAQESKWKDFD